jgi:hypothetical protein
MMVLWKYIVALCLIVIFGCGLYLLLHFRMRAVSPAASLGTHRASRSGLGSDHPDRLPCRCSERSQLGNGLGLHPDLKGM